MDANAVLAAVATGLLFGLSLIVAVGPQNAFVLRQGLRRDHVALVVGVCAVSDVLLIAGGVGGAAAALDGRRWLVVAIGVVGVAFLLGYAALAARRAIRPVAQEADGPSASGRGVLAACLAFTWLNPGVYVDTVFLVAPVSHSHGHARWWFALGAMVASVVWFAAIGFGARALAPLLRSTQAWQVLDASVAVVLVVTAVRTALTLR